MMTPYRITTTKLRYLIINIEMKATAYTSFIEVTIR